MKPTILAIDNDPIVLTGLNTIFRDTDFDVEIETATSGDQGVAIFRQNPSKYSVVIVDFNMKTDDGKGINGDEVARQIKEIHPGARIIMLSGKEDEATTEACLQAGAEQFLIKGMDESKLVEAVKPIIFEGIEAPAESPAERAQKIDRTLKMRGCSPEMGKIADIVLRYAPFDEPVLVIGESGVGKEGIVRAVHENSGRRERKFVAINCGAMSRELLESELFGHERGSFTGAVTKKIGLVEQANGGTVFLDEIGDMPLDLQVKLLRALQEKKIQPVGGTERAVDFRIVAATHRDLKRAAEQKEFREDLYYRLKYLTIEVPPLRERPEDIEPLVKHFHSELEGRTKLKRWITPSAMRKLKSHRWPGNVRELEATVKRAFALADGRISEDVIRAAGLNDDPLARLESLKASGNVIQYADLLRLVEETERWLLIRAMELSGNVKGAAAALLGMNHNTMNYRRTILGIEKPITLKKGGMK